MHIHDIVGAVLRVDESIRAVPPISNIPHLGLCAVRGAHARLRLGVVDLVAHVAGRQLLEDARLAASQGVAAVGGVGDGLELPVLVDGAPDGDAVVVFDLEGRGEVFLCVDVDAVLGDVVPHV